MNRDVTAHTHPQWRKEAGRFAFLVGIAVLVFTLLLLLVAVFQAKRDGMWPVPDSTERASNHGPWMHYDSGMQMVDSALLFSSIAALASLLSAILHSRGRAWILLVVSVVVFWNVLGWAFHLGD